MRHMRQKMCILLLAMVLHPFMSAGFCAEAAEVKDVPEVSAEPEVKDVTEVKEVEINRDAGGFTVQVHYPVLGTDGIDSDLARWAEEVVRNFERAANKERQGVQSQPYSLDVSYTLTRPSDNVASVIFEVATYTGGAHGNMSIITRTYDLRTSKLLMLTDIFGEPDAALKLMSIYTYEALSTELGPHRMEEMLTGGTAPSADNFSTLSLHPDGVRIHFSPYQVAPWSSGSLHVDMPLEALADARPQLDLWGRF